MSRDLHNPDEQLLDAGDVVTDDEVVVVDDDQTLNVTPRSDFADSAAVRFLQARGRYNPSQNLYYHPWIDFKLLMRCLDPFTR